GDDLREELPRAAHERLALEVLLLPRPLANEDEPRPRVADAEDQVRAVRRELAASAVADRLAQGGERRGAGYRGLGEEVARRRRRARPGTRRARAAPWRAP